MTDFQMWHYGEFLDRLANADDRALHYLQSDDVTMSRLFEALSHICRQPTVSRTNADAYLRQAEQDMKACALIRSAVSACALKYARSVNGQR